MAMGFRERRLGCRLYGPPVGYRNITKESWIGCLCGWWLSNRLDLSRGSDEDIVYVYEESVWRRKAEGRKRLKASHSSKEIDGGDVKREERFAEELLGALKPGNGS